MILIHDTPGYRLGYKTTHHGVAGTTVELFAKHPKANRPRWQRIACFTLPPDSLGRLSRVFGEASLLPGPSWGKGRLP